MTQLRFDTPDNSATSLRLLAEHVRRGDAMVLSSKVIDGEGASVTIVYHAKETRAAGAEAG